MVLPVAGAGVPVVQTIFNGLLVGSIPAAVAAGRGSVAAGRTVELLVVVVVLYVTSIVLGYSSSLLFSFLGPRFALEGRRSVTDALNAPTGIAHLEDPELADEVSFILGREREWVWQSAPSFAYNIFNTWAQSLGSVVLLATFRWWLPLVAVPAWVIDWRHGAGYSSAHLFGAQRAAPGVRRAAYLKQMATGSAAAKEVRAFGLAGWAVERFREQWQAAMVDVWANSRRGIPNLVGAAAAKVVAGLVMVGLIADAALAGRISLAALAIYAPAALAVVHLGYMGDANTYLSQATHLAGRAGSLVRRLQAPETAPGSRPAGGLPAREIRFESVGFAYPNSPEPVLQGFDLTIAAGESVAVVGDNGAGKTTLIKLLCRLYEPDEGRITVDGIPLAELDVAEWRSRIGVIFQDFVRWELPLADNLAFGSLGNPAMRPVFERAMSAAGADDLLADRPDRMATILARGFEGGTDLSGGQWQKVALARALAAMGRGAGILVLDEPTASLDVRAEEEVFGRLIDATKGVTTILVSHRFNTVRRADRIAVVVGGRVVEQGSHADLMAADGNYARMYRLQADRFSTAPAGEVRDEGSDDA